MPVSFDIFPELNLVIYVCTGLITPTEFFKVGDEVALDPRLSANMNIILDFFLADLETTVSDLYFAIRKNQEARESGHEPGETAVLTRSTALRHLGESLRYLSLDSITHFGIFHTEQDVIHWLELPEAETLQLWAELKRRNSTQAD